MLLAVLVRKVYRPTKASLTNVSSVVLVSGVDIAL